MHPINYVILIVLFYACQAYNPKKESRVEYLPYYNEATFTPHWLKNDDVALDTFHRIHPFNLINQEGDSISEKTFAGKIYVTDFFFTTCPGICPQMTANLGLIQEAFLDDDEVLLLSHSVTPTIDTVGQLMNYALNKGINSAKWHLATGDQEQIYRLGRNSYFVEEDLGISKDLNEFLHTENFVLIDKDLHIRGIYNGLNKASVNQLIADIKTLKLEG